MTLVKNMMARKKIAADSSDQVDYLLDIASVDALRLLSVDGMVQKQGDYHQKKTKLSLAINHFL